MVTAVGTRIGWPDVPVSVRQGVERVLGSPVVQAVSQAGGFSPGTADRVLLADGRTAFVKAVGSALNQHSPGMHRREGLISGRLPNVAGLPRLIGSYDDGDWVALVFEEVAGRQPDTPWRVDDVQLVLATLGRLADQLTPSPLPDLPPPELRDDFLGWHRLITDPDPGLAPWATARLDRLAERAGGALAKLAGDTLVHWDVRSDNLLIGPDRTVTLVDWPWAFNGAPWIDRLQLLLNVRLYGGIDVAPWFHRLAADTAADPADLADVLAGLAGYFLDVARRPAPAGLPTIRAFQQAQGDVVLTWLAELELAGLG
jgi:hypothetical protein